MPLLEVTSILSKHDSIEEEDLARAAQALLARQFVYREDWGQSETYDLLRRFNGYYKDLFAALGFELVVDDTSQLIGLLTPHSLARPLLRLDETLMLLTLRLAYQEEWDRYNLGERGAVQTRSSELLAKYETVGRRQKPQITRMREIMTGFEQRGLVKTGPWDTLTLDMDVTIRPAILYVAGDGYLAALEAFSGEDGAVVGADSDLVQTEEAGVEDADV